MKILARRVLRFGHRLGLNKVSFLRHTVDGIKSFLTDHTLPIPLSVEGVRVAGMPAIHYITGEYEHETVLLLRRHLRTGDVFVDIGAQVGFFTLYAANLVGESGRVIALEPFAKHFHILTKNIARSGYTNIEPHQVGVSDEARISSYYITSSSLFRVKQESQSQSANTVAEMRMVPLDTLLSHDTHIDILKIDIEGGESAAFRGMERLVQNNPAMAVIVEIAPKVLDKIGMRSEDLLIQLQGLGFRLFLIQHDGSLLESDIPHIVDEARAHRFINIYCSRTRPTIS